MDSDYPAFETLGIAPDFLTIGASAMHGLRLAAGAPTVRELSPDARRAYDRTQRAAWARRRKFSGKRVA